MKKSLITSALILSTTFSFAIDFGSIAKGVVENVTSTQNTTQTTPPL